MQIQKGEEADTERSIVKYFSCAFALFFCARTSCAALLVGTPVSGVASVVVCVVVTPDAHALVTVVVIVGMFYFLG